MHAGIWAPFAAKEVSLLRGTSFLAEYLLYCSKSCVFYAGVLSCTFGMRHLISENKDRLLFDMQYNFKFMRNNKIACDILLYFMFSWPIGLALNVMHRGRYIRGTFSYSLFVALVMRLIDAGAGQELD